MCSKNIDLDKIEKIELQPTIDNTNFVTLVSGKDQFFKEDISLQTTIFYIATAIFGNAENTFFSLLKENNEINIYLRYKVIEDDRYQSINIGKIYCSDFKTNKEEREITLHL